MTTDSSFSGFGSCRATSDRSRRGAIWRRGNTAPDGDSSKAALLELPQLQLVARWHSLINRTQCAMGICQTRAAHIVSDN